MSRSFVLLLVACAPLTPPPQGLEFPPVDSGVPLPLLETADTAVLVVPEDTAQVATSCSVVDPVPPTTDRYEGARAQVHTLGCVHADGSMDTLQYVGWVPATGPPKFACANRLEGSRTSSCTYPMRWEMSVYVANCPGWGSGSVTPAPYMCVTPGIVSFSDNGFDWDDLTLTSYVPYTDGSFYFYSFIE